jgi:integrase
MVKNLRPGREAGKRRREGDPFGDLRRHMDGLHGGAESGTPLQRILGHSTTQLTSDTYAHLSPRHMAGEADRVTYPEPELLAKVLPFG